MADVGAQKSLKELLAEQLPKDIPFAFYHYSTPPTRSSALFSTPPQGKSERTYCESHLLAASITPKNEDASKALEELLILAIEILIYTTRNLTTIFVSKADSTGYLSELKLPRSQSGSPLKAICGTFVSWLARERQRAGKKVVISLFARAQDQYLFPASIDNKNKHVLDDRGLVKWWCKVLDPIVWQYKAEEERRPFTERLVEAEAGKTNGSASSPQATAKGYLVIPGFETYDTLRYTPAPQANTPRRWAAAHPLLQIAPHPAAPPRCLVPHFPDDPKSRFLDELDEELPDRGTDAMVAEGGTPSRSNGIWKSVKTLDQFWEFMAFRQECSSGRIVGFIWVVISPPKPSIPEEDEDEASQQTASQSVSSLKDSQGSVSTPRKQKSTKRKGKIRTDFGPIPLVLPRIKTASSNLSAISSTSDKSVTRNIPENTPYYTWPTSSRGTVCLSTKDYNRAHEILIRQNFSTHAHTAKATKRWKDEIGVLGGVDEWSWAVTGTKESSAPIAASNGVTPITTVMGVRKKGKPDATGEAAAASTTAASDTTGTAAVTALDSNLIRKKAKIEPTPVVAAGNSVNTLSTGLVRKKPKA